MGSTTAAMTLTLPVSVTATMMTTEYFFQKSHNNLLQLYCIWLQVEIRRPITKAVVATRSSLCFEIMK